LAFVDEQHELAGFAEIGLRGQQRHRGKTTVVLVARRPDLPSGGGARPTPVDATVRLGPTVLAREGRRDETLRLPELEIAATLGVPAGG